VLPSASHAIRYSISRCTRNSAGVLVLLLFVCCRSYSYPYFPVYFLCTLLLPISVVPSFWVWHFNPIGTPWAGSAPRPGVLTTLEADNSPQNADRVASAVRMPRRSNGCMYVRPRHLDERFHATSMGSMFQTPFGSNRRTSGGRCCHAGKHVGVESGSPALGRAGQPPRSPATDSACLRVPARDCTRPFNSPLLNPGACRRAHERLGLIGKQVLHYRHMYPALDDVAPSPLRFAGDS